MSISHVTERETALKAEIARLNSGWYDKLLEASLERDAQRKVLEQALEALQNCANGEDDVMLTREVLTAIQGVLK